MASYTYNDIFVKEFTEMQKYRKSLSQLNIYNIPIPKKVLDVKDDKLVKLVIDDPYYGKLTDRIEVMLVKPSLVKRKFNNKGEFERNEDGDYITSNYDVPTGSVAILSELKINVPLSYQVKGFDYVDFIDTDDNKRYYIYVIPKENCYLCSQLALVLSANKISKNYKSIWVNLQNGYKIYLSVIPFKGDSKNATYRVLETSMHFDKLVNDMKGIMQSWFPQVSNNGGIPVFNGGIMYHPKAMELTDPVKIQSDTVNNLAFGEVVSTLDILDYVGIKEYPLSHTKNELEEQNYNDLEEMI